MFLRNTQIVNKKKELLINLLKHTQVWNIRRVAWRSTLRGVLNLAWCLKKIGTRVYIYIRTNTRVGVHGKRG